MRVGVVVVAHSGQLAEGVCELARQMAPDVVLAPAGGADDGSLGTSYDRVSAAVESATVDGGGAVVLYDLGSARMTAELVVEGFAEPGKVRVVVAPLVEGTLAAAVSAQGGATLDEVVAAAEGAAAEVTAAPGEAVRQSTVDEPTVVRTLTLRNPLGLHARPAALLARLVADRQATVRVGRPGGAGVDVRSVLAVVGLGLRGGDTVEVAAGGADAESVVAAVSAAIEAGMGEAAAAPPTPPEPAAPSHPGELGGVPAAAGLAIGHVVRLRVAEPAVPEPGAVDAGVERQRLAEAREHVDAVLAADEARGGPAGEIAGVHRALLSDPALHAGAESRIAAGRGAASAWWAAVRAARHALSGVDDELVAGRAVDVNEIGLRVLAVLLPAVVEQISIPTDITGRIAGAVVVADDPVGEVVPGIVPTLVDAGAAGLAMARGAVTSHSVVVARGLGLPAVIGLGDALSGVSEDVTVLLDGDRGVLRVEPDATAVASARSQQAASEQRRAAAVAAAHQPVVLPDGRRIAVAANIGSAAEARAAVAAGADGVGLLRTELLFLGRHAMPSEDEQYAELAAVLDACGERPVVVRTLDAGGDKPIPALGLDPVRHGFLGQRGLRYGLAHLDVLHTQLRAVLRACADRRGPVAVMAPMVTVAGEVTAFRVAITRAAASLAAQGIPHAMPDEVGVMVEVPAAALAGAGICDAVDFVSVGTNDLVQYVMAADRTEGAVADLYRPDHPAVWHTLERLTAAARAAGCRVAVCGEMAAEPEYARRLIALGVTELSVAPVAIPDLKAALRAQG